jgi:hypothetical protein
MRVTTLIFLLCLVGLFVLGIVFRGFLFAGWTGFRQWQTGFRPAETPTDALEKFRTAIRQRQYGFAATYCTKDYADILEKNDSAAAQYGRLLDKINGFMESANRQPPIKSDEVAVLLNLADPFPNNFKVQGSAKQVKDTEAVGAFAWEPLPVSNQQLLIPARAYEVVRTNGVDAKMFQRNLVPAQLFEEVRMVKEGNAWKINVAVTPAFLESARYFEDHWRDYESEMDTFQRYMTNERYDLPKAFEGDVAKYFRKAAGRER